MISIVCLCTNIASVNFICYSKLPLPNIVSITDISLQFLHSKPSIPGTGSGAQTYKTRQQHQQKT